MPNTSSLSFGISALLSALALISCGGEPPAKPTASPAPVAPMPAPPVTSPAPPVVSDEDSKLKETVLENLKKAQLAGVTVEVSGGEVTLGGDVAKDKVRIAMQAANDAKPKKVNNKLNPK